MSSMMKCGEGEMDERGWVSNLLAIPVGCWLGELTDGQMNGWNNGLMCK